MQSALHQRGRDGTAGPGNPVSGAPKGDKMELIVQKTVELGIARIVPVTTKRAVVKLDEKKALARTARWQSIAEAAAKQSSAALCLRWKRRVLSRKRWNRRRTWM